MNRTDDARHLETFGYVVLHTAFDPAPLAREFDETMRRGPRDPTHLNSGSAGNQFRYVPMMSEHTPVSVGLVVDLAHVAEHLLDGVGPARPSQSHELRRLRRMAPRQRAARAQYRDGELFEPLDADTGALRVLPGSHTSHSGDVVAADEPGVALATRPGDSIVFDEHLIHGSRGGHNRRQWRIDFVADTGDDDALRAYYGGQFAVGWDGGYDVDRSPSYGGHWRSVNERWNARLEALGAYDAATAEEDHVRRLR